MFTLQQISTIHSKVKSGADFPNYVQELKTIGMSYYDAFVADGHTDYFDTDHRKLASPPKYNALHVADVADRICFKKKLKRHQQGDTDYPTFCRDAADNGVEKWRVDINAMTCTYYDKAGNILLEEIIPAL